jgi:O-methyltransferase involved in polyketide biosynthesis
MLPPSLTGQIQAHCQRIELVVNQLDQRDPLRDWCDYELRRLLGIGSEDKLEDANAMLQGMRQLLQLLFEHNFRLSHPQARSTEDSLVDSYLTMRSRLPADAQTMAMRSRFSIEPSLMFHQSWDNPLFDPVSPTAKIVGYLRSRDPKLRIAEELSMEDEGKRLLAEASPLDDEARDLMASLFQCRYHAVNVAVAATGTKQIIELAAGISPRGLQWARTMPETIYVESDLPALMIRKAKLLRNHILKSPTANQGVLHCCSIDVLDSSSWQPAFDAIDRDSRFVIVSEGLLLYFTNSELRQFFQTVRTVLSQYPNAVWITDFVTQENLQDLLGQHPAVAQAVRRTFASTGRSVIAENPFQNEASIHRWAAEFELSVMSTVPLSGGGEQVQTGDGPGNLVTGSRKIWTLSARNIAQESTP